VGRLAILLLGSEKNRDGATVSSDVGTLVGRDGNAPSFPPYQSGAFTSGLTTDCICYLKTLHHELLVDEECNYHEPEYCAYRNMFRENFQLMAHEPRGLDWHNHLT
jgi:hypothetical protein